MTTQIKTYSKILCLATVIAFSFVITKTASAQPPEKFKKYEYVVNYGGEGCWNRVDMELVSVGDHLYKNQEGTLFFLTYSEAEESYPIFVRMFPNHCADHIDGFNYNDIDTTVDFSQFEIKNFIDIPTFSQVKDLLFKDKYRYYHVTKKSEEGYFFMGKAHSFDTLENGFYRGSDGDIYIQTQSMIKPPEEMSEPFYRKVPVSDYKSFQSLADRYYAKDADHVYRVWTTTDGKNISIIEEADPESFEVIKYRFGKDKNHVFDNGRIVDELNAETLVVLCENPNFESYASYYLVKDDKNVFYGSSKIEGIDAATFECIIEDSKIVYRDKDWIYDEEYFSSMNPEDRRERK